MPYTGELSALLTAFLWSVSSFAFTEASERMGSLQLNVNRIFMAAVFLYATIIISGIGFSISSPQIFYLSISGIIGLVFGDTFLFKAYQHVGARISMLLMALSPAMSGVLAYFFLNESLSLWGIIGIIVTMGGIALVVFERGEIPSSKYRISKIGIFYGLMGALGQAGGLVFAKLAFNTGDINGFVATFVRIVAAFIIMFPLALAVRRFKNPFRLYARDLKALTSTIAGTIFGPYLGITFSLIAIEHTKVGIASTLMSMMPIIMLPIVRYYYKEKLNWRAIIGAVIAVAGVAILFMRQ
ncbi:MAG: DMT family transporter [Ignavibacteriaceae bacterium]